MKYDDFIVGETFKTKSLHITEEEIIQFATTFDPQYMHIDKEKAEQSRFKGIIASGMHTLSISFKLWVEEGKYGEEVVAGTQMNNVKFIKPVYPGNTLYVIAEITNKKSIKKENGLVTVSLSTYNENEEIVFKGEVTALINNGYIFLTVGERFTDRYFNF
ncbi:MaoC family dehydratase [Staphylococcus pseudintermedius]|uniref:MaoC family dehydratase n=1 Tax=Staphylococcus pseudintermedius TaxID=283734 RepID=UPI0039818798